jgi:hypothetical protein
MATPSEDIETFLEDNETLESHRLEVALLFAQGMVRELQACVREWEATVNALDDVRRLRSSASSN